MKELITLCRHDSKWRTLFEHEKAQLESALSDIVCQIHHVGSTAVPDLLAKPVIDIAVESEEYPPSDNTIKKMAACGYQFKGDGGVAGRAWFIKGQPRQFNLHLCEVNSPVVKQQLCFRDRLIEDGKLRREYELIKMRNFRGKDIDSFEYASSKADLITRITNIR